MCSDRQNRLAEGDSGLCLEHQCLLDGIERTFHEKVGEGMPSFHLLPMTLPMLLVVLANKERDLSSSRSHLIRSVCLKNTDKNK